LRFGINTVWVLFETHNNPLGLLIATDCGKLAEGPSFYCPAKGDGSFFGARSTQLAKVLRLRPKPSGIWNPLFCFAQTILAPSALAPNSRESPRMVAPAGLHPLPKTPNPKKYRKNTE